MIVWISSNYNWVSAAALGTIAAVIWAVYAQDIKRVIDQPVLELKFYEETRLINTWGASFEKNEKDQIYLSPFNGLFLTIGVTNRGNSVAKDSQAFIAKLYRKGDKGWLPFHDWLPVPLRWPVKESLISKMDLHADTPYAFNLGSFSRRRLGSFLIDYTMMNWGQSETIKPGTMFLNLYSLQGLRSKQGFGANGGSP